MRKLAPKLLIFFLVFLLFYACRKDDKIEEYCTYEIDGYTFDSVSNQPLINSHIMFAQQYWDFEGSVSYKNFHECQSDSSGYFYLLVDYGLINLAGKIQVEVPGYDIYHVDVNPGITHLDTIYFKL